MQLKDKAFDLIDLQMCEVSIVDDRLVKLSDAEEIIKEKAEEQVKLLEQETLANDAAVSELEKELKEKDKYILKKLKSIRKNLIANPMKFDEVFYDIEALELKLKEDE